MKKIMIFELAIICLYANAQTPTNNLIESYLNPSIDDTINYYQEFCKIGKEAISILIESIDTKNRGVVGFVNPKLSTPSYYNIDNYKGIEIAYMIEFLIKNAKSCDCSSNNKIIFEFDSIHFYEKGIIVKVDNGKPVMSSLKFEEILEIKRYYSDWWNNNKNKSPEELSKNWKNNSRALTGTKYIWI